MYICKDTDTDLNKYPYHIKDVNISDPCILADPVSGHYFTYVQFIDGNHFPDMEQKQGVFYYLESEDLVHWTRPCICFEDKTFWANRDFWAPEVHIWKGKYYLISSFRAEGTLRSCEALVADSPRGPFRAFAKKPLTPEGWQCLDGTLYEDREGQPWLVFCHEWMQVSDGQICAIRLTEDLSESIGDPIILFRASDGPWVEKTGAGALVTDGPFLYRAENGDLLMLWSGFAEGASYAVGYAKSASKEIYGPWIQENEPLYAFDGGHGMLFHSFSGSLMMACHCPNDHPKKRILLFEMEDKKGKLSIINEATGNWYKNAKGRAKMWVYHQDYAMDPVFSRDTRCKK